VAVQGTATPTPAANETGEGLLELFTALQRSLEQLAATQEALRGLTKLMMRNYLENCATEAIRSKKSDDIYDELMEVIFKFAK
jgi:DNA-binding FrmR family transcriptional regulator